MLLRKSLARVCLRQPERKKKEWHFRLDWSARSFPANMLARTRAWNNKKLSVMYDDIDRKSLVIASVIAFIDSAVFFEPWRAHASSRRRTMTSPLRARARTHSLDARTDRHPRNSRSEARMRTKRRRVRTSSNRVWHHASLLEVYVILLNPFSEESVRGARR